MVGSRVRSRASAVLRGKKSMSVRLGGFSLHMGEVLVILGLHRGVVEKPRAVLQRG